MTGEYDCEAVFDSRGNFTGIKGKMTNYKGKTYKVTSIGSKAFYKCSKLKIRYAAYRKLFKKAGLGSKVTWKKG